MKQRPFFRWLISLFLLVSVFGFLLFVSDIPQPLPQGSKIPEFVVLDDAGNKISSKQFAGKILLINFWATWCEPCLAEMPSLEKLYQHFKDKDFVVLGINRDGRHFETSQRRVEIFKKQVPLSFPILYDVDGKASELLRVSALPVTFIIGRDGFILEQILGSRDWTTEESFDRITKRVNP